LSWILANIIRYRKRVIKDNLQRSFKNYSTTELDQIIHKYYCVLSRYISEIFTALSWKKKDVPTYIQIENLSQNKTMLSGHSAIIMASHYGNWELTVTTFPLLIDTKVIAFYKPLSSEFLDRWMKARRSTFGLELYPIDQTVRVMQNNTQNHILYVFIGDQGPLNMNGVYWNTFLNLNTPWLTGAEKLARKYNYPVYYMQQIPVEDKTLKYKIDFHNISQEPSKELDGSIIEKYTRMLETEILDKPEYWLWSHKRWKRANKKQ
jgi:Kdo2-lipid IVA lauroyltransferase/acyltransferase